MLCLRAVWIIRIAISPLLAIRILRNGGVLLFVGQGTVSFFDEKDLDEPSYCCSSLSAAEHAVNAKDELVL